MKGSEKPIVGTIGTVFFVLKVIVKGNGDRETPFPFNLTISHKLNHISVFRHGPHSLPSRNFDDHDTRGV